MCIRDSRKPDLAQGLGVGERRARLDLIGLGGDVLRLRAHFLHSGASLRKVGVRLNASQLGIGVLELRCRCV